MFLIHEPDNSIVITQIQKGFLCNRTSEQKNAAFVYELYTNTGMHFPLKLFYLHWSGSCDPSFCFIFRFYASAHPVILTV